MSSQFGITEHSYSGSGYLPMVDFESWRVAILRYDEVLTPERMPFFERHNETDEIFVLLEGECLLFWTEEDAVSAANMKALSMKPGVIYNVTKNSWHTSFVTEGSQVLIVENKDTDDDNSDYRYLSDEERRHIIQLAQQYGSKEGI